MPNDKTLASYTRHDSDCAVQYCVACSQRWPCMCEYEHSNPGYCTCGLDALLKAHRDAIAQQTQVVKFAREATAKLRDATREGIALNHFTRDPLVMAIHAALDFVEQGIPHAEQNREASGKV